MTGDPGFINDSEPDGTDVIGREESTDVIGHESSTDELRPASG
jgi:hypothetical protein